MIEFEGLGMAYPGHQGRPPVAALQDVDLKVADGEFVSIVGPSGCGKSTLLHLVAGFGKPTSGRISVDGREVSKPGSERAVVFQQAALYPWLNVRDNIGFGLRIHGIRGREYERRVQHYLGIMGLTTFEHHAPYHLSGGMRQRVAIARALITEPEIMLMDEPFGALDAQTRNEMQRFLLRLWRTLRPTVLFVTHDVEESILLGDRVVIMTARPGRVALDLRVPFARPREWDLVLTPEFIDVKRRLLSVLQPQLESAQRVEDFISELESPDDGAREDGHI
ncbi:MAG: ABC transporter ATP-binding protein [Thermaerobacter sp.]|nr:ABC transporter ATP-binding protein [Thermaerobacter sp.]